MRIKLKRHGLAVQNKERQAATLHSRAAYNAGGVNCTTCAYRPLGDECPARRHGRFDCCFG